MSIYDWLLFLHVLSAFAFVGGYVWFTIVILAGRRTHLPRTARALFGMTRPANALVGVGAFGTLVLGIWLAIDADAYHVWDGWVIAALVLWAVTAGMGQRQQKAFNRAQAYADELTATAPDTANTELNALLRTREGLLWHLGASAALVVFLWLMIYKPGA